MKAIFLPNNNFLRIFNADFDWAPNRQSKLDFCEI